MYFKNRKHLMVITISLLSLIFFSCKTTSVQYKQESPIDFEEEQGRSAEIGREVLENESDAKVSIALIAENPNQKNEKEISLDKYLFDNLDVAITQLGKFDVVPRAELAAIVNESRVQNLINNQTVDLPDTAPRYLIIYNIIYNNFETRYEDVIDQKKLDQLTKNAAAITNPIRREMALLTVKNEATVKEKRYVGFTKVKITMYDTKLKKRVYAQTLSGYSENSEVQPGNIGLLNSALENVVKDYMIQFATDFCPTAAVIMTKGSGQVAMLNVGTDQGVLIGTIIQFINYDESAKKTRAVPFAEGEVFEVDSDSCWVKISNYKNVRVRKYSVARVKPTQAYSSRINSYK